MIELSLRGYIDDSNNKERKMGSNASAMVVTPTVVNGVRIAMEASTSGHSLERSDFFRGGDEEEANDRSYFVMYRYSTNNGDIVKSFLKLSTPAAGAENQYTFSHFVWGDKDQDSKTYHLYRECEGVILKMPVSYYLVGINFTVPVNKRVNPESYKRLRPRYRRKPTGMGMIAIEYQGIRQSPDIISGLTMTLGAGNQPVMARVGLLYIGAKSSLKCSLDDDVIQPGEIKPEDLAEDIMHLVSRVRARGGVVFSETIQVCLGEDGLTKQGATRMSNKIMTFIDNTPAWARRKRTSGGVRSVGAIETVGEPERPRD